MSAWLALFLGLTLLQRAAELFLSARNTRRVRALGGVEHGAGHFPLLVLVHVLWPVALVAEVVALGTGPGPLWPAWLGLWLGAQALRYLTIRALGGRWTVRILVIPGMPLVRRGPYRWMAHPNYVAVAIELIAGSLLFGAWRTAAGISLVNLVALSIRIQVEEAALAGAGGAGAPSQRPRRSRASQ